MNTLKRYISKTLIALYRLFNGKQLKGIRILMYHSIGYGVHDDPSGLFTVNPERFKSQIDFLCTQEDIEFLSLCDNFRRNDSKLGIVLTFDDGYKDNLITVAPYLTERNIPFTVFVTSDKILNNHPDYLGSTELFELSQMQGVTIGAHGKTHRHLAMLSLPEIQQELMESKAYIEHVIGKSVTTLSYPHGSLNQIVIDQASHSGYEIGVCSQTGTNQKHQDKMKLKRTEIHSTDDKNMFRQKIYGGWDWHAIKGVVFS